MFTFLYIRNLGLGLYNYRPNLVDNKSMLFENKLSDTAIILFAG